MHVTLVIGATGILRPAAETLLTAGTNVVAVGRSPERFALLRENSNDALGTLIELSHDATSATFADALAALGDAEGLVVDDVVAYAPATSAEVLAAITASGRTPAVEVATSSTAAPPEPDLPEWTLADLVDRPWKRLVLGWQYDEHGTAQWHDPEQISAAALATRDGAADRILGTVTPWVDRPH